MFAFLKGTTFAQKCVECLCVWHMVIATSTHKHALPLFARVIREEIVSKGFSCTSAPVMQMRGLGMPQ